MTDEIRKLHEFTVHLSGAIDQLEMEDLLELVEFRESVINTLLEREEKISELEKQWLSEINKYDELVKARMLEIKEGASVALHNMSKANAQKKSYENQFSGNSYFVDRRK
jgi:DNA-binding protein H-NS